MGVCCYQKDIWFLKSEIVFKPIETYRPSNPLARIQNSLQRNPFYHFGTKRQIEFFQLYSFFFISSNNAKTLTNFFLKNKTNWKKIHFFIENNYVLRLKNAFDVLLIKKIFSIFSQPELIFIKIVTFILSKTSNNKDLKKTFLNEIFSFSITETHINLEFLKKTIDALIDISLISFEMMILLPSLTRSMLITNVAEIEMIHKVIFVQLNEGMDLSRERNNFVLVHNRWYRFILEPLVYAGYSNLSNIDKVNLMLKDKIIMNGMKMLSSEALLNSFLNRSEI